MLLRNIFQYLSSAPVFRNLTLLLQVIVASDSALIKRILRVSFGPLED